MGAEMTRWLQAARQATGAGTELTKPTKHNQGQVSKAGDSTHAGFVSVLSILSEGGTAEPAPVRADGLTPDAGAFLDFLREQGPHSYGAVARALGWGATQAWRTEDELRTLGLIVHSSRGMSAACASRTGMAAGDRDSPTGS